MKQKEPWYMSRRVWGAALSGLAVVGYSLGFPWAPEVMGLVASILGVTSFINPKK